MWTVQKQVQVGMIPESAKLMCLELEANATENPDLYAEYYGLLLYGGVKVRLNNVTYCDETTIQNWKKTCAAHGYNATVKHNIARGHVELVCYDIPARSRLTMLLVLCSVMFTIHLLRVAGML